MSFSTVNPEGPSPSPTLHIMRPENVFRGHSADDMRRHICLLSAALARCPDGQPTSSSLTDSDPRLRKKFNLLQHLATLLTIGTDRDKNAAAVNAVTGSIEPGRIVSVIATRNAHALPNATSDAEIVKLETGNGQDGMASELLTNWFESSGKVDIDQHLREVTAILSYILQRPAPDRPSLEGPFAAWITHRAFMKLAARIENAQQIWGTYPAELMRMWSAHDSSDKMPVYNVSFSNPPSALLVKRLPHYGIQPDDSEGSATSSSHPRFLGPAKAWLSVLVDVLDALQSILTPSGKRVDDSKLDDGKILTMVLELGVLSQMLNSTLLQELRESTFNHKLQMRYDEWQKAKHKTWITGVQRAGHLTKEGDLQSNLNSGEVGSALDTEDALDDSDPDSSKQEPAENAVTHLWRYLKTFTAWFSAARAFCQLKVPCQLLDVYQLRSTPSLPINKGHIEQFVEGYLTTIEDHYGGRQGTAYRNANALLKKAFYQKDGRQLNSFKVPPLHAEAALMALARACHHPSEAPRVKGLENIDTTFTSNEVVIGISKKCCRCCSLFAQHMATSLQEGQEELHFVLPGTHSIIYPWLPPAFGVPDHVLASMRRVLFATFHHVAVQHDAGFTSTQSSPASDDIEDGPMQTEQWASSQGKK